MKITVRIGAAIDGDLSKILYEPLAQGSTRARAKVRSEAKGSAAEELAIKKDQLARERQLLAQQNAHKLALERDSARQRVREETRVQEETRRQQRRTAEEQERTIRRSAETAARLQKRETEVRERGVRSFASSASGTAAGVVRRGVGVAADIARGAGVSFDVGAGVKKRVDLEASATNLANSGYVEGGKGMQAVRQDPRAIMADIQRTGEAYAISQDTIVKGLDAFVGKTGELQTGREMLDAFAKTAKATGADIEDVAAAAGAISNKLGDVPNKAEMINKVMLAIAGQGKVGAVEIKDMATQMEKLTSQATKFQTNADLKGVVGSDTGANIAMLGVLAQAARQTEKGTAAQATQSAMAFVRDLTGATSTKRIGAKAIFTDDKKTQLRDPQEIIKDLISKTKGDLTKLTHLMPNSNSRAVVNSFMDPYMKASNATKGTAKEKDAAGRAAVDAKFSELKQATLSPQARDAAVGEAMNTTASKAELFQQKLDRLVGDMADQVIPSMLKLAPAALSATEGLTKVVTWAAGNPFGALGAVIGLSLGKALADQASVSMAGALTKAFAGNLSLSGAAIGTVAIASVGMMAIEYLAKKSEEEDKRKYKDQMDAVNNRVALRAAQQQADKEASAGGVSPETAARLANARHAVGERARDLTNKLSDAEGKKKDGFLDHMTDAFTGKTLGRGFNSLMSTMLLDTRVGDGQTIQSYQKEQDKIGDVEALQKELADVKAAMAAVNATLGGTLKVSVEGGLPAPSGSTTGPNMSGGF